MLVLSRKKNQRILIGNDIEIVVVEIRGNRIRLGVQAPRDVPVHRSEVVETIKAAEHLNAGTGDGQKKYG